MHACEFDEVFISIDIHVKPGIVEGIGKRSCAVGITYVSDVVVKITDRVVPANVALVVLTPPGGYRLVVTRTVAVLPAVAIFICGAIEIFRERLAT